MAIFKKYPPYGKAAVNDPPQGIDPAIIICTGSDGFKRARESQTASWCGSIKHKLALPFREDPQSYLWPVNGQIVMLWPFGEPEPSAAIERLAICCLNHGAVRVLYTGAESMTRYLPQPQQELPV